MDDTYYNASGFKDSPRVLEAFHRAYPKAPGPPVNLEYWLKCEEEDTDPDDRADDDKAAAQGSRKTRRRKPT